MSRTKREIGERCKWKRDDDGVYYTECGEAFQFTHDGLADNKARFCIYCGGRIQERSYSDDKPFTAEASR